MNTKTILEHESGNILLCEDNPAYYIEAPVNSIAITKRGDVYRKFRIEGSDGWVLLTAEGGPRIGSFLDAANAEGA